jgi:hypothetical protein
MLVSTLGAVVRMKAWLDMEVACYGLVAGGP